MRQGLGIDAGEDLIVEYFAEHCEVRIKPAMTIPRSRAWFFSETHLQDLRVAQKEAAAGQFEAVAIDDFVDVVTGRAKKAEQEIPGYETDVFRQA